MCATYPRFFFSAARPLPVFYKLGWIPINHIGTERHLILLRKILDGRALRYLSEKLSSLKYCKLYVTRSQMPYCLPIPRTKSRKLIFFFFNVFEMWNSTSDNKFFYSADLKKFKRNYFDCITRKFTPGRFKVDRIFQFVIS